MEQEKGHTLITNNATVTDPHPGHLPSFALGIPFLMDIPPSASDSDAVSLSLKKQDMQNIINKRKSSKSSWKILKFQSQAHHETKYHILRFRMRNIRKILYTMEWVYIKLYLYYSLELLGLKTI